MLKEFLSTKQIFTRPLKFCSGGIFESSSRLVWRFWNGKLNLAYILQWNALPFLFSSSVSTLFNRLREYITSVNDNLQNILPPNNILFTCLHASLVGGNGQTFKTPVGLLPTYLFRDTIRASLIWDTNGSAARDLGIFDSEHMNKAWWIDAGFQLRTDVLEKLIGYREG